MITWLKHSLHSVTTYLFQVSRVLPHWLCHPYSVSTDLQNLDCHVDAQVWLHSTLKSTLLTEGVTHLFPVQKQVVPFILKQHSMPYPLQPHDICVSAPTGSGKTLSFVLPIVQVNKKFLIKFTIKLTKKNPKTITVTIWCAWLRTYQLNLLKLWVLMVLVLSCRIIKLVLFVDIIVNNSVSYNFYFFRF